MKKTFYTFFLLLTLLFNQQATAQGTASTLDVVAWNVEWFGASFESPADDNLQAENVKKILRHINADLYALVEVVDSSRLRHLTDSLGPQYAYFLSPYGSGNSTGTGTAWLNAQKLAFIYNKNIFTNASARGMLRNSGPAYTAFASGRFPYMLSADVTLNNVTKRMNFILIHGKAGSTQSDYERRRDGARELKDTLDTYYSTAINFLVGDFNDALYGTICSSCGTSLSSYDPIIKDSTDTDHYNSITLPLGVDGQSSMTNFPNVVDNHVISNEAAAYYVPNSARILIDVRNLVANYGLTTSDHYPVFSQYNLNSVVTGINNVSASELQISSTPNPFQKQVTITAGKTLQQVKLQLLDIAGRSIKEEDRKIMAAGTVLQWHFADLPIGTYYLRIRTKDHQSTIKLLHVK
jgi:hypothetical protein